MDPHQAKLVEAAGKLGIAVEHLDSAWGMDAMRLTRGDRSEIVLEGRLFSHLDSLADEIAANKQAARALMRELGIPVPDACVLDAGTLVPAPIDAFLQRHGTAVIKPFCGTDGEGVAMHLRSADAVMTHIRDSRAPGGRWLLEQQAGGEDLRLQYLGGELVAACIRKPCRVIGDGTLSVRALIDARNRLIGRQNPGNRIAIDHQVERRLSQAGLRLDSVLEAGVELQLKDVSNMAQGGHAIDVTGETHPRYRDYLDRLADRLNMRLFSLDVMTPDPGSDPDANALVLEFNARPAWLHHTFSERRQHDVPAMILRDLFGIDRK